MSDNPANPDDTGPVENNEQQSIKAHFNGEVRIRQLPDRRMVVVDRRFNPKGNVYDEDELDIMPLDDDERAKLQEYLSNRNNSQLGSAASLIEHLDFVSPEDSSDDEVQEVPDMDAFGSLKDEIDSLEELNRDQSLEYRRRILSEVTNINLQNQLLQRLLDRGIADEAEANDNEQGTLTWRDRINRTWERFRREAEAAREARAEALQEFDEDIENARQARAARAGEARFGNRLFRLIGGLEANSENRGRTIRAIRNRLFGQPLSQDEREARTIERNRRREQAEARRQNSNEINENQRVENQRALRAAREARQRQIQEGINNRDQRRPGPLLRARRALGFRLNEQNEARFQDNPYRDGRLYGLARGLFRGMLQTNRLIRRVENVQDDDNNYLGRYAARVRVQRRNDDGNLEYDEEGNPVYEYIYRGDQGLNLFQRFALNFRELTGIYTNGDFVRREGLDDAGYNRLAEAINRAGLTIGNDVRNNITAEANITGDNVFGRMGRNGAVLNGAALGIRLAATGMAVGGIENLPGGLNFDAVRTLSLSVSPTVNILNQRADMIENYDIETWRRMRWSIGLSSVIGGLIAYHGLGQISNVTDNFTGDLVADGAAGVINDQAEDRVREMVTAWALRYGAAVIPGGIINYANAYSAVGAGDNRRQRAFGLAAMATMMSAQGASYPGAARLFMDGNFFNDPNQFLYARETIVSTDGANDFINQLAPEATLPNEEYPAELFQDLDPGTTVVTNPEGNALVLNVDNLGTSGTGEIRPLVFRSDFAGTMQAQDDNFLGNLARTGLDIFDREDNSRAFFDWSGEGDYVEVEIINLNETAEAQVGGLTNLGNVDNIVAVPRGDTGATTLYAFNGLNGEPIGYEFEGGLRLVDNGDGTYSQLGREELVFNAAEVREAVISGEGIPPEPIYLEIQDPEDPGNILQLVEADISEDLAGQIPGGVAYQSDQEGILYNQSGEIIAIRTEVEIPIPNGNTEFETYVFEDPTTGIEYFNLADGTRVEMLSGNDMRITINGESYVHEGEGIFFNSSADAVPPYAYNITNSGSGLEVQPFYNALIEEDLPPGSIPAYIQLPYGIDPSEMPNDILPIGYEFVFDPSTNDIVVMGPDNGGPFRYIYSGGPEVGSSLGIQSDEFFYNGNRIAFGSREVTLPSGTVAEYRYLAPLDYTPEQGDMVLSYTSPSITNPNGDIVGFIIGQEQTEVRFSRNGTILQVGQFQRNLPNGELNPAFLRRVAELGINGQEPIRFDPETLVITYDQVEAPGFEPTPAVADQSVAVAPETGEGNGGQPPETEVAVPEPDQPEFRTVVVTEGPVEGLEVRPVSFIETERIVTPGQSQNLNWASDSDVQRWINEQGSRAAIERGAVINIADILSDNPEYFERLGINLPDNLTPEQEINAYVDMARQMEWYSDNLFRTENPITPTAAIERFIGEGARFTAPNINQNTYIGSGGFDLIGELSGIEAGETPAPVVTTTSNIQTSYPYTVQNGQVTVNGNVVPNSQVFRFSPGLTTQIGVETVDLTNANYIFAPDPNNPGEFVGFIRLPDGRDFNVVGLPEGTTIYQDEVVFTKVEPRTKATVGGGGDIEAAGGGADTTPEDNRTIPERVDDFTEATGGDPLDEPTLQEWVEKRFEVARTAVEVGAAVGRYVGDELIREIDETLNLELYGTQAGRDVGRVFLAVTAGGLLLYRGGRIPRSMIANPLSKVPVVRVLANPLRTPEFASEQEAKKTKIENTKRDLKDARKGLREAKKAKLNGKEEKRLQAVEENIQNNNLQEVDATGLRKIAALETAAAAGPLSAADQAEYDDLINRRDLYEEYKKLKKRQVDYSKRDEKAQKIIDLNRKLQEAKAA